MATLNEHFLAHKDQVFTVTQSTELTMADGLRVPVQMFLDFSSGAIYLAFYIGKPSNPFSCIVDLLASNAIELVLGAVGGFEIAGGHPRVSPMKVSDLKFTGRIYFYSEVDINDSDLTRIQKAATEQKSLSVEFYGPSWASEKEQSTRLMAFISHDSRDKQEIARPLVDELRRFPGCSVWYDEYSLKLGDSLRESIEKGLKECQRCVLLLSKNFLDNNRWTKVEFDSVFTRELVEERKLVLPVWCGVTRQDVYSYSPSLANRVAVNWEKGAEEVARQIYLAASPR